MRWTVAVEHCAGRHAAVASVTYLRRALGAALADEHATSPRDAVPTAQLALHQPSQSRGLYVVLRLALLGPVGLIRLVDVVVHRPGAQLPYQSRAEVELVVKIDVDPVHPHGVDDTHVAVHLDRLLPAQLRLSSGTHAPSVTDRNSLLARESQR